MQNQCVFCHSTRSVKSFYPVFTFNNKTFEYITCTDCGLVYISPLLDQSDLEALYSLDYHQEFYFTDEKRYDEQLALVSKLNLKGRLLDYGCGDASFLKFFRNKGFELVGAEYNPALVSKLSQSVPDCRFFTIDELLQNTTEKFDVIHLGDVLEHLTNPSEIINLLKNKLTPQGVFFVEGPIEHNANLGYLIRKTYFQVRKAIQPGRVVDTMRPYHVFFSNRTNQLQFFRQHGLATRYFQIFEWAWPFPEEWHLAKTPGKKLQYLFGQASKGLSKTSGRWGNRFYYVGQKQ